MGALLHRRRASAARLGPATATLPRDAITPELRAQYERDGVVVIRNVFDSHDLESLIASIDHAMASPSAYATEYEPEHEEAGGRFFGDYYMFRRIPGFREFIFESPSAELACRLLQSAQVNFFCAWHRPLVLHL